MANKFEGIEVTNKYKAIVNRTTIQTKHEDVECEVIETADGKTYARLDGLVIIRQSMIKKKLED